MHICCSCGVTREANVYRDEAEVKLSAVQLEIFDGWRRPDKALPPPKLQVSSLPAEAGPTMIAEQMVDLIQDVTTDCSVVASLCAVIARASRGYPNVKISWEFSPFSSNQTSDHLIHLLSF